ncbi:MAG TPA: TIGR02677 family protein [Aldersonia sp.]
MDQHADRGEPAQVNPREAGPRPFAHVNAANAGLYRRIMAAFGAAKRRFTVHLRPEDVHDHLRASGGAAPDLDTIADALGRLQDWGNLSADPDTSRVRTVEEFHRARFLYQMTREGEAVEEALATYDAALGRRGSLQAAALDDIVIGLRSLLEHAADADPDPAKVYLALDQLTSRFNDLADNAQAFMSSLQRTIDLHDAEVDAFLAYKDQLIEYLERFIKDLVSTGAEISRLVLRLQDRGVDRLLDIAARRISADAAPGADDAKELEFGRQRLVWAERWAGFRGWFLSESGHPSQASLLRTQARAAVPRLLTVVATLNDRRAGRSDRSADFRALALWFAQAPDESSMHRLWRTAFGLHSSRHLTVAAATLDARDETPVSPNTSWTDAPSILISPRLRQTGQYERRGRPNAVIDRSERKRFLAEHAAAEAAETAAARTALAAKAGTPIRLSDLGVLEAREFGLFLRLLGDALATKAPGVRSVHTTTSDGTMAISLHQLDDARVAEIPADSGVFRGPDHLLHITDLVESRAEAV